MNTKTKQEFLDKYNNDLHRLGRLTLIVGVIVLLSVPFLFGMISGVSPDMGGFAKGIINVGVIYYPVAIVEFLVYAPMLGVGGSYLAFITGNITNMKIPCAMTARDIAKTEVGTPENEIVSTISIATSGIVTTLVIVVGVVLMVPLQPVLQSEILAPAFDNVVPALFGALALQYFRKSIKLAIIPLVLMCVLNILIPSLISQTSVMMLVCGAFALGLGFVMFKKGMLK